MLSNGSVRTSKVLKEHIYVLQRGLTYLKEGLRTLKRAYVLQREPTYFKEGLCLIMGAYV